MAVYNYDILDAKGHAEWTLRQEANDEFSSEERLSYDGPRYHNVETKLCLQNTVYTRS